MAIRPWNRWGAVAAAKQPATGADETKAKTPPGTDVASEQPPAVEPGVKTNPIQVPGPVKSPTRGELTSEEIEEALSPYATKVRNCLAKSRRPASKVSVKMLIRGDGTTTYEEVSPGQPVKVARCLESTIAGVTFPETGREPTSITQRK